MNIRFKEFNRETVISFFRNDVACAVVHLKNGDSFAFYNDSFKALNDGPNNESVVMKAVCDVHDKLGG
ncbi:hypothetical protein [Glaciecola sp. SC05]|uniref:hypothetical protein n=1 Tax=Glaciecola sp. SC05 TaxID=1987355 RepID=UPI0035293E55